MSDSTTDHAPLSPPRSMRPHPRDHGERGYPYYTGRYGYGYIGQEQNLRIGIAAIFQVLRRNWFPIVLIIAVFMAIIHLFLEAIPPRYLAQSTIVLAQTDTRMNLTDSTLENADTSRVQVETEIDVLRSRGFALDIAGQLNLIEDPAFNTAISAAQETGTTITEPLDLQYANVVTRLLEAYTVTRRGESLALDISVLHTDPEIAAEIANRIPGSYIQESLDAKQTAVRASITFLAERSEQLAERLGRTEIEIADFIRDNQLDNAELSQELQAEHTRLRSITELFRSDGASDAEIAEMEARLALVEDELRSRTRAQLALAKMQRTLDADLARFDAFTERRNRLESQLDVLAPAARLITRANVPTSPAKPNRTLILLLGFAAGAIVGLLGAVLRELLDRRVWTGTQVERATGLRTLTYLPRIRQKTLASSEEFQRFLTVQKRSPVHEAVRGLITVVNNMPRTEECLVVALTSPIPNEGKSTLATALGATIAQEQQRVLVIDFDVHRQGLTELIGGQKSTATIDEVWRNPDGILDLVERDLLNGVDLMSFKRQSVLPRRLLGSPEHIQSWEVLRGAYDAIVIDTPPVLVSDEANRLAEIADFALLVSRWGKTSEDALASAADTLMLNRVSIAGVILNDVDLDSYTRRGYGYYFGSQAYGFATPDEIRQSA